MSSIKHLEMAAALSAYPHIEIKKSLFSTKAIYTPTHSQVKAYILEYSPSEGERLERLLEMPFDKMAADIQQKGKPVAGANGNFLFRFGDFQYKPVFEPRFYEGKDVESITQLV